MTDPALDTVTGRYFDVLHDAKANSQAYAVAARRALRAATERLAGPCACAVWRGMALFSCATEAESGLLRKVIDSVAQASAPCTLAGGGL